MNILKLISFMMAFGLFGAQESRACSCMMETSIGDSFMASDHVFAGRVISKVGRDFDNYDGVNAITDYEYTLSVTKIYKGNRIRARQTVISAKDGAMCGFNMIVGKRYLLWVTGPDDKSLSTTTPVVTNCSRSKLLSESKSEIAWLDENSAWFGFENRKTP